MIGGFFIKKQFFLVGLVIILFLAGCNKNANDGIASTQTPFVTQTADASVSPSPKPTIESLFYNQYTVNLEVFPKERIVTGITKIKYVNNTAMDLDKIYFHTYLNAFSQNTMEKPYFQEFESKIFQNGKDYGYFNIEDIYLNKEKLEFDINQTIVSVSLKEPLKVMDTIEFTILFEAYIPKINHRTGANEDAMWFGNFLPILSVHDSFGWHTDPYYPAGQPFYSEISNYDVSIVTPSGYSVIGPGNEVVSDTAGKKTTHFTAKLVRDFAFSISQNYTLSNYKTNSGIDINIYTYSQIDTIKFIPILEESLNYFSDLLGTYPYKKLDIVETGLFSSSGMDYPQIIFMDTNYLKDDKILEALIHEIGNQWFYNIIGNNQIKETWLSEGLSIFLQEKFLYSKTDLYSEMTNSYNELKVKLLNSENKGLLSDLSVYKNWSDLYNIQCIRAKLMMYSLSTLMGEEKFNDFLKTYYIKYSFKVVDKKSFIETAEEIYGGSLEHFFDSWMQNYDLPPL